MRRRRSVGEVVDDAGSEGEEGDAHQNRGIVVKLKVLAGRQGAHGCRRNSSPEMLLASGAVRRRRGEATERAKTSGRHSQMRKDVAMMRA